MVESPLMDLSFDDPVFSQGDDPIGCLNKAMAFLMAIAFSKFPSTNNQLRTSSNLRNQTTIQDGRVTMQQTEELDTYDSDCDDISNAKAVLMVNISNYGSDVFSELKIMLFKDLKKTHKGITTAGSTLVLLDKVGAAAEVLKNLLLILNGDSPPPTRIVDGVVQIVAPTIAEQRLANKNKLKARGTLLMALPDRHKLKFNIHKDATSLMEAIEKRFR
nr:hypothetical protein [Tanacetum cinerariifolium]